MLTIAWDVDDVLNPFMRCWFEDFWKPRNLDCDFKYEDITSNPPTDILGMSIDEYRKSIDEFRLSPMFASMKPNPSIYSWFKEHGHLYRHIALTAVPRGGASASADWTLRHFGDWIRSFVFVPSERPGENIPVYDTAKQQYLNWLGKVNIFIEDNPDNTIGLEQSPIECFIVNRPWNCSSTDIETILARLIEMRV